MLAPVFALDAEKSVLVAVSGKSKISCVFIYRDLLKLHTLIIPEIGQTKKPLAGLFGLLSFVLRRFFPFFFFFKLRIFDFGWLFLDFSRVLWSFSGGGCFAHSFANLGHFGRKLFG